jgi:hypothetical protein
LREPFPQALPVDADYRPRTFPVHSHSHSTIKPIRPKGPQRRQAHNPSPATVLLLYDALLLCGAVIHPFGVTFDTYIIYMWTFDAPAYLLNCGCCAHRICRESV